VVEILSETRPIAGCSENERQACFRLLSRLFLAISWEDFVRDFEEKDAVMLLRDAGTGEIGGFSTLLRLELEVEGVMVPAVFSGDTAVLPAFRTSFGLGREVGRFFFETRRLNPGRTPYYVLISKGWRTYRVLPLFFRSFFPCPGAEFPALEQSIRDAFGTAKYPRQYDPVAGVIRAQGDSPRVHPDGPDALPPVDAVSDFFVRANPGYLRGDELVCVARIEPDNYARTLRRLAAARASAAAAPRP
jgi:hypothetical protein